jgi:hypothetical protein
MLFLTPPKVGEASLSPSPLLDIMENLNSLLREEEDNKEILLDNGLLKLLDGTPKQQKEMLGIK